jgi:hypothetical protein
MTDHQIVMPSQSAAQVTTAISASGVQFSDLIEPVIPLISVGATTTAVGALASAVFLYRFRVDRAITIANMKLWVAGTAAGNVALGIYTESGGTWTRVATTAETAAAGTNGIQTIALATPASIALAPGTDYYAALGGDASTGTLTILRGGSIVGAALAALGNRSLFKAGAYSSGLPTSITTPVGSTTPYWIGMTP